MGTFLYDINIFKFDLAEHGHEWMTNHLLLRLNNFILLILNCFFVPGDLLTHLADNSASSELRLYWICIYASLTWFSLVVCRSVSFALILKVKSSQHLLDFDSFTNSEHYNIEKCFLFLPISFPLPPSSISYCQSPSCLSDKNWNQCVARKKLQEFWRLHTVYSSKFLRWFSWNTQSHSLWL